jgi:hypothetical protein
MANACGRTFDSGTKTGAGRAVDDGSGLVSIEEDA